MNKYARAGLMIITFIFIFIVICLIGYYISKKDIGYIISTIAVLLINIANLHTLLNIEVR